MSSFLTFLVYNNKPIDTPPTSQVLLSLRMSPLCNRSSVNHSFFAVEGDWRTTSAVWVSYRESKTLWNLSLLEIALLSSPCAWLWSFTDVLSKTPSKTLYPPSYVGRKECLFPTLSFHQLLWDALTLGSNLNFFPLAGRWFAVLGKLQFGLLLALLEVTDGSSKTPNKLLRQRPRTLLFGTSNSYSKPPGLLCP